MSVPKQHQQLPEHIIQHAIAVLQRFHSADTEAFNQLYKSRVPVNEKILHDPTIQISNDGTTENPEYSLSFLGIINGIFGIDETGYGPIGFDIGDDGNVTGIRRIPARTLETSGE